MSIIASIEKAGIVGIGGAGFPTHVKLNAKVEYFIVNAAECEPLLKTDQYVMRNNAEEVVKAVQMVKEEVGATYAVIATKGKYHDEIAALEAAIANLGADVTIHRMGNFYPAGDEQVMVYEVTGRVVPPSGIPLMVGCIVSNVTTMREVYRAITEEKPITSKYLTITGEVGNPTLLEAPIGTPFEKCLEAAGGVKLKEFLLIDGGPMMGTLYDETELQGKVVTKTTSALILKSNDGYLHHLKYLSKERMFVETMSACIQCTLCTDLCPREMLGHKVHPHKVMRYFSGTAEVTDLEANEILHGAQICCECAICEVIACPMGLSPRQVQIHVKNDLARQGVRYQTEQTEFKPDPMREYKGIPPRNILIKMGLQDYEHYKLEMRKLEVDEVFIPTQMHIGAPSIPVVQVGDKVEKGDLIAKIPDGALGANIHASISGQVMAVTDKEIHVKAV